MKKILFLLSSLWLITACSDNNNAGGGGGNEVDPSKQGTLKIALSAGDPIIVDNNAKKSASSSKASQSTDMSKFSLGIKDNTGKDVASYSSYTQMPSELALTAGKYTIAAKNDGLEDGAAFDLPLYAGASTFAVEVGQTTNVSMVCELKSTGVKVECSPKMLSLLTDITVQVMSASNILTYTAGESRTGWFSIPESGALNVSVKAKKIGTGEPFGNSLTLSGVKAKELRKVALDIHTSGEANVVITIDEKVISKDVTIVIPDGDDVIDNNGDNGSWEEGGDEPDPTPPTPTGPVIIGASHEGQPFNLDEVINVDRSVAEKINELDVLITSQAAGGIDKLLLTIESEVLQPLLIGLLGIDGQIDLANPPTGAGAPPWVEMFADSAIGLIDANVPIKGKSSHMFSVGKLMALLGSVDTTGGVEHKFHLSIVDASGTTSKTLTVKLVY